MSQEDGSVTVDGGAGGLPQAPGGVDPLSATTAHIENQIEQLSSFKEHLTSQLDGLRTEGARLLEKQKTLAEEKAALAAKQAQLEAELAVRQTQQEAELNAAREELARKREELQQLAQGTTEEKTQLEKAGQEQRTALERRTKELERWERTIVEEEERVLARQVALASELEKIESKKQKAETQGAVSAELEAELARLQGELKKREEEVEAVGKKYKDEWIAREKELLEKLEAETQNSKLKTQNEAETGRINELEGELATVRADAETARKELEEWEKEFEAEQARKAQEWAGREEELKAKTAALEEQVTALQVGKKQETPNASPSQREAELAEQLRALEVNRAEREERIKTLEAELTRVENRRKKAEKELSEAAKGGGGGDEKSVKNVTRQRARLIVAARRVRGHVQHLGEDKRELARRARETARQEQVLKAKAENLEQVKRLMEKQELIMSRKLANHAAIKTVAAVGIFVMLLLGMTVGGVYWLVWPVYHSEAVVQLTALAPDSKPEEVIAALKGAAEKMKSEAVLTDAWGRLRQDSYAVQDNQADWAATFGEHLSMVADPSARTLSVSYTGPAADGVAAVCNDLTTAYVESTRVKVEGKPDGAGIASATVVARAVTPLLPVKDTRLKTALTISAVLLFVSLLAVLAMRHFVRKQLKDIDHMAEEADWEQVKGELAGE